MTQSPKRQAPAAYKLRVAAHLGDHWSPWFDDLTVTPEDDGTTSLTGVVTDQAQLHGLLAKIRDLGVTLISVELIEPPGSSLAPPAAGAQFVRKRPDSEASGPDVFVHAYVSVVPASGSLEPDPSRVTKVPALTDCSASPL